MPPRIEEDGPDPYRLQGAPAGWTPGGLPSAAGRRKWPGTGPAATRGMDPGNSRLRGMTRSTDLDERTEASAYASGLHGRRIRTACSGKGTGRVIDPRTVAYRVPDKVLKQKGPGLRQVQGQGCREGGPLVGPNHDRDGRGCKGLYGPPRTVRPGTGRGGTARGMRRLEPLPGLHRLVREAGDGSPVGGRPGYENVVAAGRPGAGRQAKGAKECRKHSHADATRSPAGQALHLGLPSS